MEKTNITAAGFVMALGLLFSSSDLLVPISANLSVDHNLLTFTESLRLLKASMSPSE